MGLRRDDFEKAVKGLLAPHHLDYIRFIQARIEKDPQHLIFHRFKSAQDVIRMVQAETPTVALSSVDEALDVLHEAIRRLKG